MNRIVSEDVFVMDSEPFSDFTVEYLKDVLQKYPDEKTLAYVYAGVSNKVGWLMHSLDDDDCTPEMKEMFKCWNSFEELLCTSIIGILEKETDWLKYRSNLKNKGYYCQLIPFMKRNGFSDRNGWWMNDNPNC